MEWIPLLFLIAFIALFFATAWKIFEKAGEKGWQSLVPIYNVIVFLQIIGKPWWWLFLMFIPVVGYVFTIWSFNMLSKSFGKDEGYTAGLFFLGFVFFPMLAFGKTEYQGPYGDPIAFAAYRNKNRGFDFENNQFAN